MNKTYEIFKKHFEKPGDDPKKKGEHPYHHLFKETNFNNNAMLPGARARAQTYILWTDIDKKAIPEELESKFSKIDLKKKKMRKRRLAEWLKPKVRMARKPRKRTAGFYDPSVEPRVFSTQFIPEFRYLVDLG